MLKLKISYSSIKKCLYICCMRIKAITKIQRNGMIYGVFKTDSGFVYSYTYKGDTVRTDCKIRGIKELIKDKLTKITK